MKKTFYVRPVWDAEARVWVPDTDIIGMGVETETIEEFWEVVDDVAAELVIANHWIPAEMAMVPLASLIPFIAKLDPDTNQSAA